MLRKLDDFEVVANFSACLRSRGKVVTRREVHNVFTNTGRNWMSRLVAWSALGSPDAAYTNRRVRWVGLGTGTTYVENVSVTRLETAVKYNSTDYLAPLNGNELDPDSYLNSIRFLRDFSAGEISVATNPVVALSEAGLFVDVYKVSEIGGTLDSAAPGLDTTLNPSLADNAPVAYARFEPINKTQDFTLEVRWDFRF
jgi:hypothetical protein